MTPQKIFSKNQHMSDRLPIDKLLQVDVSSFPNTIVSQTETTHHLEEPSQLIKELVTYLNSAMIFEGKYPPLDEVKKRFPELEEINPQQLKKIFKDVNDILENKRDCPPYQINFVEHRILDPQFVAACNLILDSADKRSIAQKLKSVGLTTTKWKNMLRSKKYQDFYNELVDNMMEFDTWQESRVALARNVSQGDLSSIKYFHELTNKFSAKSEFDPRVVTHMLMVVLEIVSKHVDGSTARLIADEIEVSAVKELGINT